jgi:hypothetical protein
MADKSAGVRSGCVTGSRPWQPVRPAGLQAPASTGRPAGRGPWHGRETMPQRVGDRATTWRLKSGRRIWFIIAVSLCFVARVASYCMRCKSFHTLHALQAWGGMVQTCNDATIRLPPVAHARGSPARGGTEAVVGNRCHLFESRLMILIFWPPSPYRGFGIHWQPLTAIRIIVLRFWQPLATVDRYADHTWGGDLNRMCGKRCVRFCFRGCLGG